MSKLYKKYLGLKKENKKYYYLFKVGMFYIWLDQDAIEVSKKLNLKLTHLNDDVLKCGFPIASLDKYLELLKKYKIKVKIIDLDNHDNRQLESLLNKVKYLDLDKTTGFKALCILTEMKELLWKN